jgi:hypothetical protein
VNLDGALALRLAHLVRDRGADSENDEEQEELLHEFPFICDTELSGSYPDDASEAPAARTAPNRPVYARDTMSMRSSDQ